MEKSNVKYCVDVFVDAGEVITFDFGPFALAITNDRLSQQLIVYCGRDYGKLFLYFLYSSVDLNLIENVVIKPSAETEIKKELKNWRRKGGNSCQCREIWGLLIKIFPEQTQKYILG